MSESNLLNNNNNIKGKFMELIEVAGNKGKYQKVQFLVLTVIAFVSCLSLVMVSLHKTKPHFDCFDKHEFEDGVEYDIYKNNKRYKIIHQEECVKEYCAKTPGFENEILTVLVLDSHSIVNLNTELDTECRTEEYFDAFTQQVFLGRLLGSLIFSYVSDRFGRWYTFTILLYGLLASQLIYLFYKNTFVILINGLCATICSQIWNLVCQMATESMDRKMYSLAGGVYGAAYAFTGIFNIIIIYFFSNWNYVVWVHLILTIGCVYFSFYYITETPIYLLENQRYEELKKVLIQISVINNKEDISRHKQLLAGIDEITKETNVTKLSSSDDKLVKKEGFSVGGMLKQIFGPYIALFGNYNNVMTILKTGFIYNSIIYIYYGQILYVEQLPGNADFNLFMAFIGELLANIAAGIILTLMDDRKKLLIIIFAIIAIVCYGMLLLTDAVMILSGVFVSAIFITIAFVVFMLYFTEIVDVKVKSISLALMSNTSSVLIILSPYLIKLFLNSAYFMFSCLSVVSLLNLFILPKSKGGGDINMCH
jgi:MFS family permease